MRRGKVEYSERTCHRESFLARSRHATAVIHYYEAGAQHRREREHLPFAFIERFVSHIQNISYRDNIQSGRLMPDPLSDWLRSFQMRKFLAHHGRNGDATEQARKEIYLPNEHQPTSTR